MKMIKLSLNDQVELDPELLSVSHLVTDSLSFELVCKEQTFKIPKDLFLLVSPFFRSLLRSQPAWVTAQVMIPDVASEPIVKLQEIIQHLQDPGYQQTLTLEELKQMDDLFDILRVDTNFFKISIKNDDDNEDENFEMDDSYGFETLETNVKDEENGTNDEIYVNSKTSYKESAEQTNKDDLGAVFTQLEEFLGDSSPEKKHREENADATDLSSNQQKSNAKKEQNIDASGLFACQFCPEAFNQQSLIDHLKNHVEDISYKDLILVCPVKKCEKNFFYINNGQTVGKSKQLGHLEEHLRAKHTKIPCVSCAECGKEFFSTMALHYHQKQHLDNMRFYCTHCEHFKKVTLKEFHMKKCKRKYACPTCSKSFVSKKHLEVHEIIHSAEKPFKCQDCPKAFGQKGNLKTHELKMHSREKSLKLLLGEN